MSMYEGSTTGGQDEPVLRGAIRDVNSRGRFDLLLYDDGILAVKGNYFRTIGLAASAGAGGGGLGAATIGGLGGEVTRRLYGKKRQSAISKQRRSDLIADRTRNHFTRRDEITMISLTKKWHAHTLIVSTESDPAGRVYSWKPAMNNYTYVRETILKSFGASLTTFDP